ncbi:SDR family oxidoreductase [Micromonospora sp. C95]|uniref:SDR family oxidoreductase n=1 Tax=Micromonospora sp. C95 TaxID=2824882 RepID=UPI001B378DF6|nr:SDR family oxidoreductase [Micromonospora sp. C95]MBQ1026029.1 SDR family oxidoreductase [Micromonospora sp. C95]
MRVLLTGATGVVGSEVAHRLGSIPNVRLVRVARRPAADGLVVAWRIGTEPAPAELRGGWDVIIHAAASTRWTLSRAEAEAANVAPVRSVLELATGDTHLVHVSTAYVGGERGEDDSTEQFDGYRNGYEWSKAAGEALVVDRHAGPVTVLRPPLILGRRGDGAIRRFSGPYTLLQSLVSGLAAVVVGDPEGYAEIAPVDQVADVIVEAALGTAPAHPVVEVVAGGEHSMRLATLVEVTCRELNAWRARHGAAPIAQPPLISRHRWHRFFLPLADQYLSPIQRSAVDLLGMFESYTSMRRPFTPTRPVEDPLDVLVSSVRYWADAKPRLAAREPQPWALIEPR